MPHLSFGWIASLWGTGRSGNQPLLLAQQAAILPVVVAHFDSLWVYDHFFGLDKPTAGWLEGWTAATWLAARFPTVQIGTLVLGVGYRNPALVAKMAASLQILSGGRLVLGVGAGWREAEFHAYGYPFPPAGVRLAQLEEAVQILRLLWAGGAPSFAGQYFTLQEAYCEPPPDPPPVLMIGSTGERILPLIARHADWWDAWAPGPELVDAAAYARKRDRFDGAARAAGRDPAAIIRSQSVSRCHLPQTPAEAAAWVARLRPFVDLGVTRFLFDFGYVATPALVTRFAETVIAPLQQGY